MSYCKDRVAEVAQVLGQRMLNIQRFESAGEFFEAVGFFEKAIEAFTQCKKFDRAMECAQNVRPAEMQSMLIQKIQQHKKAMYINDGKINKLVEAGDMSGLEMLASRGQWEECLSLAEKQGSDFINTYLMKFAKTFLQQGQFKETARVLTRYNTPAIQQMLPVYKTIAVEVLAAVNEVELQILREMLQKLIKNLEEMVGDRSNPIFVEFMKYLMVTHLLLLKSEAQRNRLDRVSAKLCTSLLRYCKDIRADKAFMEAGDANRKIQQNDMAFIFLNRYIDLYDAIEDPENNPISDNADFEGTDIPSPYDISLPEKNLIGENDRDKIRDWVLQINMEGDVGQNLPCRTCEHCNYDGLYEASLSCPQCNAHWKPCIISGYPLVKSQSIQCKFCNMGAIRDYWNDFIGVTQHCPWCNSM
jgi:intraflagellar transport protein 172